MGEFIKQIQSENAQKSAPGSSLLLLSSLNRIYFYPQDHSTEVLHYDLFMSQRVNW